LELGVILGDVMDQVARRLDSISGLHSHAWPVLSVTSPAAVVLYPSTYTFDETYGRGMDRFPLPVAVMVGRTTERTTRDILSGFLSGSGPSSIKEVIESGTYDAFDSVRVTGAEIDVMTMGGVDYWGAVFELDIVGPGSRP
jgi:hypothetical protein